MSRAWIASLFLAAACSVDGAGLTLVSGGGGAAGTGPLGGTGGRGGSSGGVGGRGGSTVGAGGSSGSGSAGGSAAAGSGGSAAESGRGGASAASGGGGSAVAGAGGAAGSASSGASGAGGSAGTGSAGASGAGGTAGSAAGGSAGSGTSGAGGTAGTGSAGASGAGGGFGGFGGPGTGGFTGGGGRGDGGRGDGGGWGGGGRGGVCSAWTSCPPCYRCTDGTCSLDPGSFWKVRCVSAKVLATQPNGSTWDASSGPGNGAPDPICELWQRGDAVASTSVVSNTTDPVWNESITPSSRLLASLLLSQSSPWSIRIFDDEGVAGANEPICAVAPQLTPADFAAMDVTFKNVDSCTSLSINLECVE